MANILVLSGPNLNLLGTREPHIYGTQTLADIEQLMSTQFNADGHTAIFKQSNAEHVLIDEVHQAPSKQVEFIIINAGAFTHTSIALRDALSGVNIPFIECHLSNVYQREEFRHHSFLSDIAIGVVCGFGAQSYLLSATAATHYLNH